MLPLGWREREQKGLQMHREYQGTVVKQIIAVQLSQAFRRNTEKEINLSGDLWKVAPKGLLKSRF